MVMAVLVLFVMAVPMRTPIARAAVMAGLFAWGAWSGRRVSSVSLLAVAAVLVLVWRPGDLFTAGFQLSFAAVLGILWFSRRVQERVWPEDPLGGYAGSAGWLAGRWVVQALVVSTVAFLSVAALVVFHFETVSVWGIVLSVVGLAPLAGLLGVGYVKVLSGLVWPSVSVVLAGPTRWLTGVLTGLVEEASGWPGAGWEVASPGAAWAVGATAVAGAWMAGGFAGRRVAGVAAAGVVLGWLVLGPGQAEVGGELPTAVVSVAEQQGVDAERDAVVLEVVMLAVGDGSCFLIRSGGETVMFDCGSAQVAEVGRRIVLPALEALGVERVDVLMLSHADLDHLVGAAELIGKVPIGEVVASRDVLEEAAVHPAGATAVLMGLLSEAGLVPRAVGQGWTRKVGRAELKVLWPPESFEVARFGNNEKSLVVDITAAGRRVRLHGDVQKQGMEGLLAGSPSGVDVADLPHHGAWVRDTSRAYMGVLRPGLVLQSSRANKLERDASQWGPVLWAIGAERAVTGRDGMTRVQVLADGRVRWWTYVGGRGGWVRRSEGD